MCNIKNTYLFDKLNIWQIKSVLLAITLMTLATARLELILIENIKPNYNYI